MKSTNVIGSQNSVWLPDTRSILLVEDPNTVFKDTSWPTSYLKNAQNTISITLYLDARSTKSTYIAGRFISIARSLEAAGDG